MRRETRAVAVGLMLLVRLVEARRVALTDGGDSPSPFLCTGNDNSPVQWGSAEMIRLIHNSQIIEVGARGIRFVESMWFPSSIYDRRHLVKDACDSATHALCQTPNGALFPSPANTAGVRVTGHAEPVFNSSLIQYFAENANAACGAFDGRGQGRTVVMDLPAVYTASACDIMQGRLVVLFKPGQEALLVPQTFGPMAYTIVLIASLICIYGASTPKLQESGGYQYKRCLTLGVCGAGTLSCVLVYALSGISFLTIEDETHFWMAVAGTIMYGVLDAATMAGLEADATSDVCVCMLGVASDALYRSPETPYAGIFVIVFAIRGWQKIYALCFPKRSSCSLLAAVIRHVDIVYSILYMCLTAEIGLVSQYTDREDWPIYAGVGAFAAFMATWGGSEGLPPKTLFMN